MSRRKLREQIFKLLFRIEFNKEDDMHDQERLFFRSDEIVYEKEDENYILCKYKKVVEKIEELDEKINTYAECWTADRMGKVEVTILRLAIYELLYDEDIPKIVAINEAVELSKKYGQDDAQKFVNGILANFA